MPSYDLMPVGPSGLTRATARANRAIDRIDNGSRVREADIDSEAAATLAKLDVVTTTTATAIVGVGRIGQLEAAVVTQQPGVSGRVAYLAEQHTLASGAILENLQQRLRSK